MSEETSTVTYSDQSATATIYTDKTAAIVSFTNLFYTGDIIDANNRNYNDGLYNSSIYGGNDHLWTNVA